MDYLNCDKREQLKKLLISSFIFTSLWCILAHGYGFMHSSFSHDVLNSVYADKIEDWWKIMLGRPVAVMYRRLIRGSIASPWLCGCFAALWIALSVLLTAELFDVRSKWGLIILSGVFATNLTVTAMTATYVYELDIDMLALFLACAAVFIWYRFSLKWIPLGCLLIAGVLGTYQSYVSVAIVLVIFICIKDLLSREEFKTVLLSGVRAVCMLLVGALIYYLALKLTTKILGYEYYNTGSYNSIYSATDYSGSLFSGLADSYRQVFYSFFDNGSFFVGSAASVVNIILAAVGTVSLVVLFVSKEIRPASKILTIVLIALIPLGMNISAVFTEDVHDLMKFAFWLIYAGIFFLTVIVQNRSLRFGSALKAISGALVFIILVENIITANSCYLKKELESDACLSLMTRVNYSIENSEEYIPGETELCFVGTSDLLNESIYGFEKYSLITGLDCSNPIPKSSSEIWYNAYKAYYRYIFNSSASFCDPDNWDSLQHNPEVKEMPAYPSLGCMKLINGVFVVKMG